MVKSYNEVISNNISKRHNKSNYVYFIKNIIKLRKLRISMIIILIMLSLFSFKIKYPKIHKIYKTSLFVSSEIIMCLIAMIITFVFWPSKHMDNAGNPTKQPSLNLSMGEIYLIFIFGFINMIKYIIKYSPVTLKFKFKNPFIKKNNDNDNDKNKNNGKIKPHHAYLTTYSAFN